VTCEHSSAIHQATTRPKKGHIIQECTAGSYFSCDYADDDERCDDTLYCVYDRTSDDCDSTRDHACQLHLEKYPELVKREADHSDLLVRELRRQEKYIKELKCAIHQLKSSEEGDALSATFNRAKAEIERILNLEKEEEE